MSAIEVKVPDIGDFQDVPVIELLVKPGDAVKKDDSLVTLESDKATMEVPSPIAGVVSEMKVKVGDKVSLGSLILTLEAAAAAPARDAPAAPAEEGATATAPASASAPATAPAAEPSNRSTPAAAATAAPSRSAATAPAAAAAAPVPAAAAPASTTKAPAAAAPAPADSSAPTPDPSLPAGGAVPTPPLPPAAPREGTTPAHASPGVRRFARELGVDVGRVKGSAPKGRIVKADIQEYVKSALSAAAAAPAAPARPGAFSDLGLPAWPKVDFAKFGPVERQPRSRIQKISGPALARNWVMIPHVTQFDEADITDLEAFRAKVNQENAKSGVKVTPLAFLIKACVSALRKFPAFNSSLDGDDLVLKQYWHIGFAADTPNGLVVPVIRDADRKGVLDIARESSALAAKAREGKLGPAEMQGGTFSISSLGGIGGTAFTPIINAPEVAILGVSKSAMKPVWDGKEFAPRLMLPLSLSYDHRVVDGASAARFTAYLGQVLADMRLVVL